jgi:hypothetical protein
MKVVTSLVLSGIVYESSMASWSSGFFSPRILFWNELLFLVEGLNEELFVGCEHDLVVERL